MLGLTAIGVLPISGVFSSIKMDVVVINDFPMDLTMRVGVETNLIQVLMEYRDMIAPPPRKRSC